MSSGTDLPWEVLGRPVKPVALGVMLACVAEAVAAVASGHTGVSLLLALAAGLLLVGWVGRRQVLAVGGLLAATCALAAQATAILAGGGSGWALLYAVAVTTGGSFVLEVLDMELSTSG